MKISVRAQIEKRIENKQQEIIALDQTIRRNRAFIAGLQEALKLLPRDDGDRSPNQLLRAGSVMAKVREFLKNRGEPLYINDILKGIGKEVNKKNRISVGGSLGNYARRGEIFSRTAPNTYGLISFASATEEAEATTSTEEEPPEDFGVTHKNKAPTDEDIPF